MYLLARRERQVAPAAANPAGPPPVVPVAPAAEPDSFLGEIVVTAQKLSPALLPRGLRNNNPGNLRYYASIKWVGQTGQDDAGYAMFSEPRWGVRAMARDLRTGAKRGENTVSVIITQWAPPVENQTAAYIKAVAAALGVSPTQKLNVEDIMVPLVAAIIRHENGFNPFTDAELQAWVNLP